ncbi:MAG TPA: cupredoxin family copper-binding protein [Dyella sp.]|uniref:cupredoxin domain-containing protein n=1 Tax=Dyella sp. TaxID=1869338 RepID=UPI002F940B35
MKRLLLVAALAAGALVSWMSVAAEKPHADKPAGATVAISQFAFSPKELTVPVGTRVVWTNRDEEPHVVTSAGNQFTSSQALDTDDSYAVTFTKPGIYAYYCSIHPHMVGTIVVH